ncbi:MAG: S24/S26 family peptidase [Opitutaceae bacterium]|jgi:hypothetical protein|nr:S24/S26 family peptidase [Opitutaceae bacterium]
MRKHAFVTTVVGVAFLAGCASAPNAPEISQSVPPPRTDVTRSQAWRDAEAVAKLDKARFTVIGAGESMRPVYGENTVLVLQKVPYESLRAGMKVAYRNRRGVVVLHQLVAEDAQGWRAVGLNNPAEDRERVTRSNLLGVVYAAFANADVE